jgi:hypothetical protein
MTATRHGAPAFEVQVIELGTVSPDLEMPPPLKPISVRLAAGAAALAASLCVTLWMVAAHRERTITSTVRTVSPTSHGSDAIGCPHARVCAVESYPPEWLSEAANTAFGAVTKLTGETTSDPATGQVYLGVLTLQTYQGDEVDIRARCVPGESSPATTSEVILPVVNGVLEIQGHRADRNGCSAFVSYRTRDVAATRAIVAVVASALTDPRITRTG